MAAKKCAICNEEFLPTDEQIPYKKRFVHAKCFNIGVKISKQNIDDTLDKKAKEKKKPVSKPKAELKEPMSEEEYAEKKNYYQYLRKLLNDELTAKIYSLSDNYINRYGFTFESMYKTLIYMYEIKDMEIKGDVVGIIPYVHDEAMAYFKDVERIHDVNKDVDINKMYQEKTIKIQPHKKTNYIKQLDITSI